MLAKAASYLFGWIPKRYPDYFESLKNEIRRTRMRVESDDYISMVFLAAFLVFVASFLAGSLVLAQLFSAFGYFYTLNIIFSLLAAGCTLLLGYYYPFSVSASIRKEIERSLPFASFQMTTAASSGANPLEIFKLLSARNGAVGEQAAKIYRNSKGLGMSLAVALQKAAKTTPSQDFADLLWGMSEVITSGGSLEGYLRSKTEALMAKHRRRLNDYSKSITLYTEIYTTLIVVGSLFFIILTAIMSPIVGPGVLLLQLFLTFIFIPLVSAGFIILLKSMYPSE
ncbi:MAG: type II secretion system F family protein [Candidatus Aenigmarchaeota archaeon]|nr:type II secretion system F family protein [Candidatus Aenigmarchaeota archaeon]